MSITISGTGAITGVSTNYSFDKSVSIGGTVTYEDVTNVDSVGIITAQSGIHVTGGSVGIGTESPHANLEVSGGQNQTANQFTDLVSIAANANNDALNAEVQLNFGISPSHTTEANRKARIQSVTHSGTVTPLLINPAGGNIGIGTDNPGALIHAEKGNASTVFQIERTDAPAKIVSHFGGGDSALKYTVNNASSFQIGIDDSDADKFKISFGSSDNAAFGTNDHLTLTTAGNFGVNASDPNGRLNIFTNSNEHALRIDQNHSTALVQFLEVESTSYAGDGIKFHYFRSATSANNFMACDSNHSGTADREFTLRGDGNGYADGTWNNNGADYAEFFESSTGAAIPVGTTVVLENNKVRAATSEDSASSIMGVVRPKEPGQASMTIGNTAWNKWSGKYLTDDFDRFILDEHLVYEWTETVEDGDDIFHSYESHQIPEGVTIPSDVVGQTHDSKGNRFTHYRLNPDFDSSLTYVPREERDEWIIVGLIGQVKILDGQPMNDRWIKMRDVSDTVEEWFIR